MSGALHNLISALPGPLAYALRDTERSVESACERLRARGVLVDVAQRYSFAVLAARQTALGLEPGPHVADLYANFQAPTQEHWARATSELAVALSSLPGLEPSVRQLVNCHLPQGSFSVGASAFFMAWMALEGCGDGATLPEKSAQELLAETSTDFSRVVASLEVFRAFVPLQVRRKERLPDGRTQAVVWLLRGESAQSSVLTADCDWRLLPQRVTFVLLEDGQALALHPFVYSLQTRMDAPPLTTVVARWDPAEEAFAMTSPPFKDPVPARFPEYAVCAEDLAALHLIRHASFRLRTLLPDLRAALESVVSASASTIPTACLVTLTVVETPPPQPEVSESNARNSSSSDLVLRCYAPQPLARAYARATHVFSDSRETIGWQLGFIDLTIRFLLAVLNAQRVAFGIPAGNDYRRLRKKLGNPSLGDYCRAAEEAARALVGRELDPRIQDLVSLYTDASGADTRSGFAGHLQALVEIRNEMVHQGVTCLPPETMAEARLLDAQTRIREVCAALRVLRHHPILFVERSRRRPDRTTSVQVLRFAGQAPVRVEVLLAEGEQLPDEEAFLLLDSGAVLLLTPFVAVARTTHTGLLESHVLYKWDEDSRCFEYDGLDGGPRTPLRGAVPLKFSEAQRCLDLDAGQVCWLQAVAPEKVASIRGAAHEEGIPLLPGYVVTARLGSGTSSTVFLGASPDGRSGPLAIKLLARALAEDRTHVTRFIREHDILRRLSHPHIVRVLDFLEDPRPALVMEYVAGESLAQRVARGPLAREQAVRITCEILSALASVHAHGVYHRDVKPANVLLDELDHARLIDFGTAKVLNAPGLTLPSDVLGTLAFAAPEQLRGEEVGPAADVYAVGRLLLFMLTGRIAGVESDVATFDPALRRVIERSIAQAPAERWASAGEMQHALGALNLKQADFTLAGPGARILGRYEVRAALAPIGAIELLEAIELDTDGPVILAVAHGEASTRLLTACMVAPRRSVREMGLQLVSNSMPVVAAFEPHAAARAAFEALIKG